MAYFHTEALSVGYHGRILIHDIDITLEKGKILTLIGPNGAGKSTILKSITRQLAPIGGTVVLSGRELRQWNPKDLARTAALVLTERIRPELMTCAEVAAMGRYPYTNCFGKLTRQDREIVERALLRVHAMELADQDFATLSDGQRQRVLLARAICQQPEILILDEPTAYLDIRHKLELLDILRDMARNEGLTVIMSLHEIDLAEKVSDLLLCVKGETIAAFGPPEQVLREHPVEQLYDLQKGSYNRLFVRVELTKHRGQPKVFVVGGGGRGIDVYRRLQRQEIPFGAGILFENDVEYPIARALSDHVVTAGAFQPMTEDQYEQAAAILLHCERVIDGGAPIGPLNQLNEKLLTLARAHQIPVERV